MQGAAPALFLAPPMAGDTPWWDRGPDASPALPRCWATLREPDRARLAHAAGLVLAPGQLSGMTAGAGVLA